MNEFDSTQFEQKTKQNKTKNKIDVVWWYSQFF